MNKGGTQNYSTQSGEGFQYEIQQAYDHTNYKSTNQQVCSIISPFLQLLIFAIYSQ